MTTLHYGAAQQVQVIWDDGSEGSGFEEPLVLAYYAGSETVEIVQRGSEVNIPLRMVPELIRALRSIAKKAGT